MHVRDTRRMGSIMIRNCHLLASSFTMGNCFVDFQNDLEMCSLTIPNVSGKGEEATIEDWALRYAHIKVCIRNICAT